MKLEVDDNYCAQRVYDRDRRRWIILPPPITGLARWVGAPDREPRTR